MAGAVGVEPTSNLLERFIIPLYDTPIINSNVGLQDTKPTITIFFRLTYSLSTTINDISIYVFLQHSEPADIRKMVVATGFEPVCLACSSAFTVRPLLHLDTLPFKLALSLQ